MHKIFRVVIDTNHIISANLSARGASSKLIDWMARERDYFRLLLIVRIKKFLDVLEKMEVEQEPKHITVQKNRR